MLGRLAVGEVSPVAVTLLRWMGVCLLLAPIMPARLRRDWPVLRPHLPRLLLMGALGFTVFNILFYTAAKYTTAINLGILQGSMPVFVLMGAYLAYRTPVTPFQAMGVTLTGLGVCVVATAGDPARLATLAFNVGDILMLGACVLYSAYTVALRNAPTVSSFSLFAVLALAALGTALPFALAEFALGQFQWPTAKGWLVVALIVVFPSFVAQVAYIKGVAAIGPGRAGVFVNLVPVFAPVLAVIFLAEPFRPFHAAALGLVIAGISLSERFKATRSRSVTPRPR